MRGTRSGIRIAICLLAFASGQCFADSTDPKPDRYLFERASEVYQVFGEQRQAATQKKPQRGLASISPVLKSAGAGTEAGSVGDQIKNSLLWGTVSPEGIH